MGAQELADPQREASADTGLNEGSGDVPSPRPDALAWLPGAPGDQVSRVLSVDADPTLRIAQFDSPQAWWLLRSAAETTAEGSELIAFELGDDPGRRWVLEQRDLDADGTAELLRHAVDASAPPCPGADVFVEPSVWHVAERRFRAVAVRPPAGTGQLAVVEAVEFADALPSDTALRSVSSGADGGGAGPAPAALGDSNPSTLWSPSGSGVGAFVRVDLSAGAALHSVEIDLREAPTTLDLRLMVDGAVYGVVAASGRVTRAELPFPVPARCAVLSVAGVGDVASGVALGGVRFVTALDLRPGELGAQLVESARSATTVVEAEAIGRGFRGADAAQLADAADSIVAHPAEAEQIAAALVASDAPDEVLSGALERGPSAEAALLLLRGIAAPNAETLAAAARAGLDVATLRARATEAGSTAQAWLVGQLGVGTDADRRATIDALAGSAAEVRAAVLTVAASGARDPALDALLALWAADAPIVDPDGAIIARIADPDASVARVALRVAGRACLEGAYAAIADSLGDPQQWIRATAVDAMADLWRCTYDDDAAAAVVDALSDPSATVRLAAAARAVEVGGEVGHVALRARREVETWPEVVAAIDAALGATSGAAGTEPVE